MEKLKFTGVALGILILLCASPGAGLFSTGAVSAAPNDELCQECQLYDPEPEFEYPIMRPSREERLRWIEGYNRAPKAHISDKISRQLDRSPEASQSLLDHLEYTPSQRDQGSCGNCWAWAGTGVMGIALDVEEGVYDRLSVQYINSCQSAVIGKTCCDGGWLEDVADFYTSTGQAIPWSNTNASWQDGDASCGTACGSISTTPNYAITSITDQTVSTQGIGQSTAIDNIKNVLDQNKAVWFGFFLATDADWDNFRNFWNNESESVIWDPDFSCGHTWDAGGGGHAVLCVGYNDDVGEDNDYWVMLNSWGTASGGRPNGLFRVAMDMDYDCAHYDSGWYYSFYWQTLDITYGQPQQKLIGADEGAAWDYTLSPNYFCLSRFQAEGSGDVVTFKLRASGSGNVKVAIYDDNSGEPGALLNWVGNTPVTIGWNNIAITSTAVVAGNYYWLGFNSDSKIVCYNSTLGTGALRFKALAYASDLPASAGIGFTPQTSYICLAGWGVVIPPHTTKCPHPCIPWGQHHL